MSWLSNNGSTPAHQSSIPPMPSSAPSSVPSLNLGRVAPNSPSVSHFSHTAPNSTGEGRLEKDGGNGGYQPQATRPSVLSPRTNGRPASAPHYPRDNSDVPEPPFVPAEEYQLQIHQTAAFAMNSGDWQNLMVNNDGSYQKHQPWTSSWIKSRGYIRAWLEFQAQADEDLRAVKELPGVRQHTHHNEVSITQQKSLQVCMCPCVGVTSFA